MYTYITHWGRVTHLWVGKLTIIGSDNGLSSERCQAIIWTNAGILLIGPLGTNFSEILIEIQTFSLKKIRLKMSSAKCCSFCLGLNVLSIKWLITTIVSSEYSWITRSIQSRSSVPMIVNMQYKWLVFHKERFQLPVPLDCGKMI